MQFSLFRNDYLFSIVNKTIALITGFVTTALLNRYLGPALKGEYTYIMNVINVVAIVGNLGVYQSYPKSYKDKMPDACGRYVTLIYAQCLMYTLIATVAGIIEGSLLYTVVFLLVPSQVMANQLSMVIMVEQIRYRQIVQITTLILKTLLMLVIALAAPTHLVLVFLLLLFINVLQCVLYIGRLRTRCSIRLLTKAFISYAIKLGVYAAISEVLLILNYRASVFMLKFYVDYYQIGLYSVGAGIAECIWAIPDAFKEVLFSRTSRGNPIREINYTIKLNMYISLVLILFMLLFGKEVVLIYSGAEYLEAVPVTQIILLGVPAMALFKITNPLYLANGKQKQYCFILAVSVFTSIVMNLLLIPLMGNCGAALASVMAYSVCGVTFYVQYIREYKVKWYEPLLPRKGDLMEFINLFAR